ncbi:MAG TPA: YsnF/AvaK domain-containing protein [Candidatus Limnocylindrales bacterium]|nr:YsnF/AvaK domain-containing protein [Candidatus Limnocylindrales bacterium]
MSDQYVNEQSTSPYTGRPISEWLDEDIELHDMDGDEIGHVVEINPDFIVAQTSSGFLGLGEPKLYYIPRSSVAREEGDDWYLSIGKDEIESQQWNDAPTESAWSSDWRDGQLTADEGRGQTRIRRYEEELEADTVQRESGEVVVNKRVVEETKTIEVPVRREEVQIERRPVSGEAYTEGTIDQQAFGGESISIPLMAEEVEVRKVVRPVEEIEISKVQVQDTEQVEGTIRREEFDVDNTASSNSNNELADDESRR